MLSKKMSLLYCLRYPNALQRRKDDGDKGMALNVTKMLMKVS